MACASAHAAAPAPHAPPAKAPTKAAEPPKPQLQAVSYEDLGKYLNQRIVVRTTLHTERAVVTAGSVVPGALDSRVNQSCVRLSALTETG